MFKRFSETELEYTKKFSKSFEEDEVIRFSDERLPDMYAHNFTFIKNRMCKDKFRELISNELEIRKNGKKSFLMVKFNFSIGEGFLDLSLHPQVTKYDYMYIEPSVGCYLKENEECTIMKAKSEEVFSDGREMDILANGPSMEFEFAGRRIDRKLEVYREPSSDLDLYVCYHNEVAIGNCELMLNGDTAKIEDFDILESFQRKGFGASMVKHLLEEAAKNRVKFVYLITDGEDTAKEMYKKCGFKKVGEKTELFFDLN